MRRFRWAVFAALALSLLAAPTAVVHAAVYHPERYRVDVLVPVSAGSTDVSAQALCEVDPEFGIDRMVSYKIKTTGTVEFTYGPKITDHVEGLVAGGAEGGTVEIHLVCERTATA